MTPVEGGLWTDTLYTAIRHRLSLSSPVTGWGVDLLGRLEFEEDNARRW